MEGKAMWGLRAWLLFLAAFEVPSIYMCLFGGAENQHFDGFASNLQPGGAQRRLWALVLALLVCSRLAAAAAPHNKIVLCHNAAVHILEAIALGSEYLFYSASGEAFIFCVIVANAVIFTIAAAVLPLKNSSERKD